MKHHYPLLYLLVTLFLVAGCAKKEIFYFPKYTGSFGPYQKVQKAETSPDRAAIMSSQPEEAVSVESSTLTAAAGSDTFVSETPLKKQVPPVDFRPGHSSIKSVKHLYNQPVNSIKLKKVLREKVNITPEGVKPVNKLAKIGLLLSLAAVTFLILAVAVPTLYFLGYPMILAALGGTVTSIAGLSQIKKNPDKYRGKGKAIDRINNWLNNGDFFIYRCYVCACICWCLWIASRKLIPAFSTSGNSIVRH